MKTKNTKRTQTIYVQHIQFWYEYKILSKL